MIEKGNGDVCDRSNEVTLQYAKSSLKVRFMFVCENYSNAPLYYVPHYFSLFS